MPKQIETVDWPDRLDVWTPYSMAVKASGGTTVYFAGVTAAPPYHHHPHRPEEFDSLPDDLPTQTRMALENLKKSLEAVGGTFSDIVFFQFFSTTMEGAVEAGAIRKEFFGDHRTASTTLQVVRLATDPRCLVEVNAIAVVD